MMRTVWIAENTMPLTLQTTQKSVHRSTGAMVFAVPPGFVARVSAQPQDLTCSQFGSFTVASRLSLHGPTGLSVSSSRVIFAGVQDGARTVPRSLCLHGPATLPFHSICALESTSVWAMTATASAVSVLVAAIQRSLLLWYVGLEQGPELLSYIPHPRRVRQGIKSRSLPRNSGSSAPTPVGGSPRCRRETDVRERLLNLRTR